MIFAYVSYKDISYIFPNFLERDLYNTGTTSSIPMKLLTRQILGLFRKTGNQSQNPDPVIICKFFNPTGAGTWYATEFDEKNDIFFGYTSIF